MAVVLYLDQAGAFVGVSERLHIVDCRTLQSLLLRHVLTSAGQTLHGNPFVAPGRNYAEYWQRNGRMHTGSVNVAWSLHSVTPEDGGFVVVPCVPDPFAELVLHIKCMFVNWATIRRS